MSVTYRTTIHQTGNNTGVPVPDEVLEELGAGRRPRVVADIDGYVLTASVGSMGGHALLAFSKAHREASGIVGGQEVTVTIRVDDAPEQLDIPTDLAEALAASPRAEASFTELAPSQRKNFVTQVTSAKQASTRQRRIATTIAKLEAGQKR